MSDADLPTDLTDEAIEDLRQFLWAAPSPFHAVAEAARRLEAGGVREVAEADDWGFVPEGYVVRDGTLVAWRVAGTADLPAGIPWRIIGAHTDSPNLRIRPRPDLRRAGMRQLDVEPYGGVLLNSWLDRDLGLAGRAVDAEGRVTLFRTDEAVLRIPQLAIHLDRDITTTGLLLNPQQHLHPLWGTGADGRAFSELLAELTGRDDAVAWDAMTHDLTAPAVVGGDLLASGRLDNLVSCWAALAALEASAPALNRMVVLFDHEEIGSLSHRGAQGTMVRQVLERITHSMRGDAGTLAQVVATSFCFSADMAHATHPNYPERHEPNHLIALGGGPAIKTNVNQRYATDAVSAAPIVRAARSAGVALQWYAHRSDLPCGSTIGPATAGALGIRTADVGAPMLGMHSARETMATADVAPYRDLMTAFLSGA